MSDCTPRRRKKPERVLPQHVTHVFNDAKGGAALTTLALIKGLSQHQITSSIYCHVSSSAADINELADAVEGRLEIGPLVWWNRKIRNALWRRPFGAARQFVLTSGARSSTAAVAAFALRQDANLIHTNTLLTPEGGRAAAQLGLPHVWHVRELVGHDDPFRFWASDWQFRHRVLAWCDIVVANSHVTAERLYRYIPRDRIVVVPNGLSNDALLGIAPAIDHDPVVVGMIASLDSRWKRQELFVRAAAKTTARNVVFRLYGFTPNPGTDLFADRLRALVRDSGLDDRFTFMGFQPHPATWMGDIDILVHPATSESFGRIVIEAMLAGRPVIGVDEGGVGELVTDGVTGLLAPTPDARLIAARIDQLAADHGRRAELGAAGRVKATTRYSEPVMVDRMLDVYDRVMRARSTG